MNETQTVLVALDPSSDRGEEALEYAKHHLLDAGLQIVLFVSLTGPSAHALREFGVAESISTSEAADVYLEQVIDRLRAGGVEAEGVWTNGDDEVADLAEIVRRLAIASIVVPGGDRVLKRAVLEQLSSATGISVVVVPNAAFAV